MDAITVRLPCSPEDAETYTIITADFDQHTHIPFDFSLKLKCSNEELIFVCLLLQLAYSTPIFAGEKCPDCRSDIHGCDHGQTAMQSGRC